LPTRWLVPHPAQPRQSAWRTAINSPGRGRAVAETTLGGFLADPLSHTPITAPRATADFEDRQPRTPGRRRVPRRVTAPVAVSSLFRPARRTKSPQCQPPHVGCAGHRVMSEDTYLFARCGGA